MSVRITWKNYSVYLMSLFIQLHPGKYPAQVINGNTPWVGFLLALFLWLLFIFRWRILIKTTAPTNWRNFRKRCSGRRYRMFDLNSFTHLTCHILTSEHFLGRKLAVHVSSHVLGLLIPALVARWYDKRNNYFMGCRKRQSYSEVSAIDCICFLDSFYQSQNLFISLSLESNWYLDCEGNFPIHWKITLSGNRHLTTITFC